jgi:hypothetical protein
MQSQKRQGHQKKTLVSFHGDQSEAFTLTTRAKVGEAPNESRENVRLGHREARAATHRREIFDNIRLCR